MARERILEGEAFRLRPVALDDAEAIVALRCAPDRGRFLHETSPRVEDQRAWQRRREGRVDDLYFAVERRRDGRFEGTVGLYDLRGGAGEWGRWVLRSDSLAAAESALAIYRLAFRDLRLSRVRCRTLAANATVVRFHDECGLSRLGTRPAYARIRGVDHDAVEHELTAEAFPDVEGVLSRRASLAARMVNR
ncbi:MAG: GNAT family N-acetyltransferase [Sandaracinaceae bacterium]